MKKILLVAALGLTVFAAEAQKENNETKPSECTDLPKIDMNDEGKYYYTFIITNSNKSKAELYNIVKELFKVKYNAKFQLDDTSGKKSLIYYASNNVNSSTCINMKVSFNFKNKSMKIEVTDFSWLRSLGSIPISIESIENSYSKYINCQLLKDIDESAKGMFILIESKVNSELNNDF